MAIIKIRTVITIILVVADGNDVVHSKLGYMHVNDLHRYIIGYAGYFEYARPTMYI